MNTRTYHGIKVYNGILEQLKAIHDTEQESLEEVRHYAKSFPNEVDYNIVSYGCVFIYYDQVRNFYRSCELPVNIDELSDEYLWNKYKKEVGEVADDIIHNQHPDLRMFKCEVILNEVTSESIIDWISVHDWNDGDALHLDLTHFKKIRDNYNYAVVSLVEQSTTLEKVVCAGEELLPCEINNIHHYKTARYYHARLLDYLEVHGNVYLCTF